MRIPYDAGTVDVSAMFHDVRDVHMTRAPGAAPHNGSPASNDESATDGWRAVEVPAEPNPFSRGVVSLDGSREVSEVAKKNRGRVSAGVPQKSDGRVEERHVQPYPSGAAIPPEQASAPPIAQAMIGGDLEGANERLDLLSAQGMTFGSLERDGVAPSDPAQWFPTNQ
jgi:hypothetical protein